MASPVESLIVDVLAKAQAECDHLRALNAELLAALEAVVPEIRRSHDAGDFHFSTAEVEAIETAIAKARA